MVIRCNYTTNSIGFQERGGSVAESSITLLFVECTQFIFAHAPTNNSFIISVYVPIHPRAIYLLMSCGPSNNNVLILIFGVHSQHLFLIFLMGHLI